MDKDFPNSLIQMFEEFNKEFNMEMKIKLEKIMWNVGFVLYAPSSRTSKHRHPGQVSIVIPDK